MKFEMKNHLWIDRNPNGSSKQTCAPFMVADSVAATWKDHVYEGYTEFSLRPAFAEYRGRCWLLSWTWHATERGNISEGGGNSLIDFEEGAKKLIEFGLFKFPVPDIEARVSA